MKKLYKTLCIIMTVILIVSSFLMVFAVNGSKSIFDIDFFSSKAVISNIENYEMNMTSVVYVADEDGSWREYQRLHGEENRIWVELEKVPKDLINAVIAIEDERFYSHKGVDWKRTATAFANSIFHFFSSNQGGSTITQQLIKNVTLDKEQNASRKVREIFRALAVERSLSKETILEAYLNTISLGNGICGVQVASNYYFNKDVSELNLNECAALASITKNPSKYDPVYHPENNAKRRETVLDKMLELGEITEKEYLDSLSTVLTIDPSQQSNFEVKINNYFIDALIEDASKRLAEVYGCSEGEATLKIYNGGYKIYSTLDVRIQDIMEDAYNNQKYFGQVSKKSGERVQSAMTIMDYSGHIVGIVGGAGEKTTNRGLNRATDSPRQPGSTMKPLGVYTPSMDAGLITPYSVFEDKPLEKYFPDGSAGPNEWYGYFAGNYTVERALEHSVNTVPCQILRDKLGIDNSYAFLTEKLHLKYLNENDKNLGALALGGCQYGITTTESAAAYAIFGNQGKYFAPTTFYEIKDKDGNIIVTDQKEGEQVIKPGTATIMHNALRNVVYGSQGTAGGIARYSKMKAYAKTGTSNDSNDLWMVAGTPYYVGSVWYGFDRYETIRVQSSASTLWRVIMTEVHKKLEYKEFELSEELEKKTYCRICGKVAGKKSPSVATAQLLPDTDYPICNGKHEAYMYATSSEESQTSDPNQQGNASQPQNNQSQTSSQSTPQTGSTPQAPASNSDPPAQQ